VDGGCGNSLLVGSGLELAALVVLTKGTGKSWNPGVTKEALKHAD